MGSQGCCKVARLELARSSEFVLKAYTDPLVLARVLGGTHAVYELIKGALLVVIGAVSVCCPEQSVSLLVMVGTDGDIGLSKDTLFAKGGVVQVQWAEFEV